MAKWLALLALLLVLAGAGLALKFILRPSEDGRLEVASPAGASNEPSSPTATAAKVGPVTREQRLTELMRLRGNGQMAEIRRRLEDIARTEPALALDLARAVARDELERNLLAEGIARVWAARDPQAAWRWLAKESANWDMPCQTTLSAELLQGMATTHPELVAQSVAQRLSGRPANDPAAPELAYEGVDALLKAGRIEDAQRALEVWSRGVERGNISGAAFALAATELAKSSPEAAAAWMSTLPPSPGRAAGFLAISDAWAQTNPRRAIEWAATLPESDGRDDAVRHSFDLWVAKDVDPAVRWLAAHESTPGADQMLYSWLMGSPVRTSAPQAAMQWAQLINAPNLRVDAMQQTFAAWVKQDPPAAARFVSENQSLTADQKARLTRLLPR